MKKKEKIWEFLTESTDLPEEAMPGQTVVEIAGENRLLIENHLGVRGYSREKIIIRVNYGEIHVCGTCLELTRMSLERLLIRGRIDQVALHRRS